MSPDILGKRWTVTYKQIGGISILLDIYPPLSVQQIVNHDVDSRSSRSSLLVPAVIYFHGGGLGVGNRQSWLPVWMQRRVVESGYAFISADYRLIPPSTGHDLLADIKDLFVFVATNDFNLDSDSAQSSLRSPKFRIDPDAIAVSGSSAGGLCAYLAAAHASPRPKALISLYGMGGNFMTPHYLTPKNTPFFRGREMLDSSDFSDYLYPGSNDLTLISDSPLSYNPDDSDRPGYPSNPRMLVTRLYLQLGVFLDYYTGDHDPSISVVLREALNSGATLQSNLDTVFWKRLVPEHHHHIFPQFIVNSDFPPSFLIHGELDTAVPVHESHHIHKLLERSGVPVHVAIIQGVEHSFDYQVDAYDTYAQCFDRALEFLKGSLKANPHV